MIKMVGKRILAFPGGGGSSVESDGGSRFIEGFGRLIYPTGW